MMRPSPFVSSLHQMTSTHRSCPAGECRCPSSSATPSPDNTTIFGKELAMSFALFAALALAAEPFPYREVTLDNGLKVLSLEDQSAPVVAVHLWYHVGAKDEAAGRQGFAHM